MAFSRKNRSSSSRPKRSRDRAPFGRSRRASVPPDFIFDYKDTGTLVRFLGPTGKIIPRRITRITAYQQRALTTEIKRARQLALLPYTGHQLEQKKGLY